MHFYGKSFQRGLEKPRPQPKPSCAPPESFAVPVADPERQTLSRLSKEPMFMKRGHSGLSVQLEDGPLRPLKAYDDVMTITALRTVDLQVTSALGDAWSVLVTVGEGSVSVQPLT